VKNQDKLFKKWRREKTAAARQEFLTERKATQSAIWVAKNDWLRRLGIEP